MNKDLAYVLQNYKEHKYCSCCGATWIIFDDRGKTGIYRLGNMPPENCMICSPIDKEIEQDTIMSSERWINLDS